MPILLSRRRCLNVPVALLLFAAVPAWVAAQSATPAADAPKALVLDFEVDGDRGGPEYELQHAARVPSASDLLRARLQESRLFAVLDSAAVVSDVRERQRQQYMHRCNGCELDLARSLGADVVVVPWIHRVSNLILTLHCEVRDVITGKVLFKRALDFRGDNDAAWDRAIGYLIRQLHESR